MNHYFSHLLFCSLVSLMLIVPVSHALSPQEEFNEAVQLFNEGQKQANISDFRGAIQKWEAALTIFQKFDNEDAIGAAIGSLGLAYYSLGDYSKAIDYYEKALVIANKVGDKLNKGAWLGNLGLAYRGLSDYRKAIDYYEQALKIADELGDKQGKGNQIGNLGIANHNLGDYRKAISYYEKALVIADEIGDKQLKGTNLGNLGLAYSDLGDYRKAIDYHEKSLAIAEAIGHKKSKSANLGNLGIASRKSGDYRKAIGYYEKALKIADEIGDKQGRGANLGNMGLTYYSLGDYSKAIDYYEKALKIADEIGDKRSKGNWLGNLGNTYGDLGDHRKAIDFHEKALAIAVEIGDKKGTGAAIGDLGNAYSDLGDYRKAIDYYEKAFVIADEIGDNRNKGVWLDNLGDAYLAMNMDEEAFSIYAKQDHPLRLGRYYLKKKDFKEAGKQFELDRDQYEKDKRADLIIPRWIGLGICFEGLKEYGTAYKWYTRAIDFFEEQRNSLSPSEREHFFEGKVMGFSRIEAYEGAVRCAFMLDRLDETFYWAENTRGRIFSELISGKQSKANYKMPVELAREEEDLGDRIAMNKKQQQTAFQKNNPELLKELEQEYSALKQKMDRLIDRLRREYPQYAGARYPQPVKLNQLALKKGETIIEYEVTDPYTIGLVIRDGKVVKGFKVEKTRTELENLIAKYRSPFQEGNDAREFSLNLAKELTELLLKPALSVIQKGEHLVIIPDESLNLLPFESLLISAPAEVLREEETMLARLRGSQETGIVNRQAIIRGLSASTITRSRGVTVAPRVTTHILFDTGSDRIKEESDKQLKELIAALKSKELKNATIRIEGHTDSIGDPKYNQKLSMKRAKTVYQYLVKNGIVQESLLSITGKGDTEPVADNRDESGRRINRRVDFVRVVEQESRQAKTGQASAKDIIYAIDEYSISYYQSASVLSLRRGLNIVRAKDATFFALGDPVFDAKDTRSSKLRSVTIMPRKSDFSSQDIVENQETRESGYSFSRLVNTEREVREVAKLFSKNKLLVGPDASEEKLKAENLSSRRYLLFSTHGILGNEIPYIKQPALILNLVGNNKEDGFLTASEIFGMDLNADLIGLSACKTGLGVQSAGEGVVGLSRAFMYAGSDSVLVSLWSVADESTYKLMVKFFEGLKAGKNKMDALQDAKNYLRASGYTNPFYWAPFIIIGEVN